MKAGLKVIPVGTDLLRAYSILLYSHPTPPTVAELALFSQWSRFDPRLAEIWVSFVALSWARLNPLELRRALLKQPWPGAVGPLLEFAVGSIERSQLKQSVENKKIFHHWAKIITEGIPKGAWEQFFIGLRKLGGKLMQEDACFAFSEYRKWGYLAREILVRKKPFGSLETETRREILKSLLERSERIDTDSYWKALGQCISKRQAERDLSSCPFLKAHGRTKGRYFARRGSPHSSVKES